ncbi:cytochrome P450 [Sphingomonas profundi]|uniref:cytochrome P450 n=1 Tax=Alterirhizorhabdus profundi TaxID=2681549 RepID=UPI0012E9111F|nr:cytochrome P450 [Sphingomonas profundi]
MSDVIDDVPTLDIDPYDQAHAADPYPVWAAIREAAPVVYLTRYDTYATGRYDEVRAALDDWAHFSSTGGVGLTDITQPGALRPGSALVEVDPPVHTDVRGVMTKIISPKVIKGWRDDFERAARALADDLVRRTEIDGMDDVAIPYVATVFPHALGVPGDQRGNLMIQGDYRFSSLGPANDFYVAARARFDHIAEWYYAAQRRENLLPGGFGEQIFAAEDDGRLRPGVAQSVMMSFFGGGLHTTISGLGSTLMHLAADPDLWARLRADRARVKVAFEEALRLETPATTWYRKTNGEAELGGARLREGMKIHLLTASANRDPRRFRDPDRYDIDRPAMGHLALGWGVHQCIGQNIARAEAEALFNALLDRIERIEPAGAPAYRPLNNLRILDRLPLRIVAA